MTPEISSSRTLRHIEFNRHLLLHLRTRTGQWSGRTDGWTNGRTDQLTKISWIPAARAGVETSASLSTASSCFSVISSVTYKCNKVFGYHDSFDTKSKAGYTRVGGQGHC